jgi:hypothetical protein
MASLYLLGSTLYKSMKRWVSSSSPIIYYTNYFSLPIVVFVTLSMYETWKGKVAFGMV